MLPESLQDAPRVYQGVRVDVYAVELTGRDGQSIQRDLVVHPGAVVILPLLDRDQVVMIRNHRYAVDEELWELPAGTLDPDESPEVCAGRELIEETGYRAGQIEALTRFYSAPGFCTELLHGFVARDLEQVGQDLEATERIIVQVLPWNRTMRMIRDGEIRDAKTIAMLLYHHAFVREE